MISKISCGIKVSVENFFQPEFSNPLNNEFIFAYKITIANNNLYSVQLLHRHWKIFDSNGTIREVEGSGVVGVQPIIEPGSFYQYMSACDLKSEMGKMQGSYLFQHTTEKSTFNVEIPAFEMYVPDRMN